VLPDVFLARWGRGIEPQLGVGKCRVVIVQCARAGGYRPTDVVEEIDGPAVGTVHFRTNCPAILLVKHVVEASIVYYINRGDP
jgi:hypothetical protein